MSIAIAYLREGYTKEQKQLLIQETKKACMEGFGVSEDHSFVFIQEIRDEDSDEQTKRMQSLFVYTTFGKTCRPPRPWERKCAVTHTSPSGRTPWSFSASPHGKKKKCSFS